MTDDIKKKGQLHRFLVVAYETVMAALFFLPRFPVLNGMKSAFLRAQGAKIGNNVVYFPQVWIEPGRTLTVGNDVYFSLGVLVLTSGGVEIGDRVLIGYRSQIISANHIVPQGKGRIIDSGEIGKPIRIGNDVWIGANCLILAGVQIGEGAVVAAGSVVKRDVEAFSVVAGYPARRLRSRIPES
jgi:acetyltransferase-like isoleucine patch superfamily enzyme